MKIVQTNAAPTVPFSHILLGNLFLRDGVLYVKCGHGIREGDIYNSVPIGAVCGRDFEPTDRVTPVQELNYTV